MEINWMVMSLMDGIDRGVGRLPGIFSTGMINGGRLLVPCFSLDKETVCSELYRWKLI